MYIKPIRTRKDHRAALATIQKLWGAPKGSKDGDTLDVLLTLVDAYEQEHDPIAPPDPLAAIAFRLEQLGRSRADLTRILGSRARVSEIFGRKRRLTVEMIRRLHSELGIDPAVLIGSYPLRQPKKKSARTSPTSKRRASSHRSAA